MDTDLLKTFLEVSRTRHFGKAAENLYLTRSAVSFRVKQLESILGVALFERQRNNIQPTPAGERMLGHAEAVLTAWERAKQDVSLSQLQSTQLAIGAGPNIWDAYLQRYLQHLHVGLPGVALRTEVLPLTVMTRQLMDVNEVQAGQYVKVDWGTAFNIIHAQEYAALPVPTLHTSSARIALDFILNNGGCAFLPEHLVQPLLQRGELNLVAGASAISRSVYVAYWAENDRLEQIKQAISFLADKLVIEDN